MQNKIIIVLLIIIAFLCGMKYSEYQKPKEIINENSKTQKIIYKDNIEITEPSNTAEQDSTSIFVDDEVVEYVEKQDEDISQIIEKEKVTIEEENKLKNTFIMLTDFIFYNGTIKGITFNELKTETQNKILDIYEKMDQKIEKRFPNYKNTIKETSTKTYHNIIEKVGQLKDKVKEKYKEEVGKEGYEQTIQAYKEDKKELKDTLDTYKPYLEKGKEEGKNIWEKVKEKASTWYEKYKES